MAITDGPAREVVRSDDASIPAPAAVGAGAVYTLATLVFAVTLAFLDRQVINLVVDAIRADVAISDTLFSLLQGASFSLVYTFTMLPIAWASDRFNRKHIIILSILAWSAATIAFGLAQGFLALVLTRACVAIGEAGLSPAATSIIRDTYPKARQATAIATLTLGVYIGGAISLAGGGPALAWLQAHQADGGLPGGLSPWRWLFLGAGVVGILAVALLAFVREPPRPSRPQESISWRAYLKLLGEIRGQALAYLCAYAAVYLLYAALGAWLPALFMRNHGWSPAQVGVSFGIIHLVAGVTGAVAGGWIVDRRALAGDPKAQLRVVRLALVALAGGCAAAALLPDPRAALGANALAALGGGACISLGTMGFQAMFPSRFAGRGVATFLLVTGVLGAAVGPTIVPLLAGALGDGDNVGPALGVWAVVSGGWAFAWLSWALRRPAAAPTT